METEPLAQQCCRGPAVAVLSVPCFTTSLFQAGGAPGRCASPGTLDGYLASHVVKEIWSYEKRKRFDSRGKRWHFMHHQVFSPDIAYEDQPYELYFRDDSNSAFGLLRFERSKDNPYRDYELVVRKIMEDQEFRERLLNPETEGVW
jgi:hypothetical protein